jgi:hypothetical protein
VKSLGHTIVARRETPVPESWRKAAGVSALDTVADGSIRVLLIDESAPGTYIPWTAIEKKLVRDNPVVVALGWSREGYGRHAQFMLPTGVYPEVAEDIPPAVDNVAAAFRMAVSLVAPPAGVVKAEEFIANAAGLEVKDTLRERADAIHAARRGTLFTYADGKSAAVKDLKGDQFWKTLTAGGCWMDDAEPARAPKLEFPAARAALAEPAGDLPLVAVWSTEIAAEGSPILSKVNRESNLRLGGRRIALHPDAARDCGVEDGGRAVLRTLAGKCEVTVLVDAGVPRGVVQVAAQPAVRDVCAPGARAKVVRA